MAEIIDLRETCVRCRHPFSMHGKAFDVPCRAMGCKAGEDGRRCVGFVRPETRVLSPAG